MDMGQLVVWFSRRLGKKRVVHTDSLDAIQLRVARNAQLRPVLRLQAPGHPRRVMRETDTAIRAEQNDASVASQSLEEIVDGGLCSDLRAGPGSDAIDCPFAQHELHNRLAPASERDSSREIVGVAAAPDQR